MKVTGDDEVIEELKNAMQNKNINDQTQTFPTGT